MAGNQSVKRMPEGNNGHDDDPDNQEGRNRQRHESPEQNYTEHAQTDVHNRQHFPF